MGGAIAAPVSDTGAKCLPRYRRLAVQTALRFLFTYASQQPQGQTDRNSTLPLPTIVAQAAILNFNNMDTISLMLRTQALSILF